MSEQLFDGLPALPPSRPMTDDDWTRLEARIDGAIETYERGRRRRLVLALAAAILVLLVAVGATWWHSTRPSPGSTASVEILCADTAAAAPGGAIVQSDGTDPRSQCEELWRQGDGLPEGPPPAPLTACSHTRGGTVTVFVLPDPTASTCPQLGYDELPESYADESRTFVALRDRIGQFAPENGETCTAFAVVRARAEQAIADLDLEGWEVAVDPSIANDATCVWYWVADHEKRLVFVYGWDPSAGDSGSDG